jgi:hypothetical protein
MAPGPLASVRVTPPTVGGVLESLRQRDLEGEAHIELTRHSILGRDELQPLPQMLARGLLALVHRPDEQGRQPRPCNARPEAVVEVALLRRGG